MKPEFTDRNRFFASIGLILIALSVVLPWLVLKESFEIHTTKQEIDTLTDIATTIISIRQWMALIITILSCIMSPFLIAMGVVLLGIGLFGWWQKESIEEKRDRAQVGKIIKDITQEEREFQLSMQTRLQEKLQQKLIHCIPNWSDVAKQDALLADYQL